MFEEENLVGLVDVRGFIMETTQGPQHLIC